MSYLQYPRLHFSGKFKASPSTINNAPHNYDKSVYPAPEDLKNVELYWNPKGDGGFELTNCVVTRIDYDENSFTTNPTEDAIIGQPVTAVKGSFPLPAAMVDLDPYQQNVSEIWAMSLQIGGSGFNLTGAFAPISFYAIWQQCQDQNAPHSSASGSGVYQSTLSGIEATGDLSGSRLLQALRSQASGKLSINFNLNTHNNKPPIYAFNEATFNAMATEPNAVPQNVLDLIKPMQQWVQNIGDTKGDIPVQDFTVYMLQQLLSLEDYNANVDKIINCSTTAYTGATPEDFLHGRVTGTIGEANAGGPDYFTPSRMLCPSTGADTPPLYFAPFIMGDDGRSITLNLGNSLSTTTPNFSPYSAQLGILDLVAFPGGDTSLVNAVFLANIPYADPAFLQNGAGFFTATGLDSDYGKTPLGVRSTVGGVSTILLNENPQGYYLRADQFVYRMNPGEPSGPGNPRGSTQQPKIHVLQWGQAAPAGVEISLNLMTPKAAQDYTTQTLGTGGTRGIDKISVPQDILSLNEKILNATAVTNAQGIATFDLSCVPPGNPRGYIDGQIYFLEYGFTDSAIQSNFVQDANDKISILVYDEISDLQGAEILEKWGRLYKIMGFLTDYEKITDISFRNIIKQMLEKPFSDVKHMPLTRDLGQSAHKTVVDWIDSLNNQTP